MAITTVIEGFLGKITYDFFKQLAPVDADDEVLIKLYNCYEEAAEKFYQKFGDSFGKPHNSFLCRQENVRKIITSFFFSQPFISIDNIDVNGFDGSLPCTEDALEYFLTQLSEMVKSDFHLDRYYTEKLHLHSVRSFISDTNAKLDSILASIKAQNEHKECKYLPHKVLYVSTILYDSVNSKVADADIANVFGRAGAFWDNTSRDYPSLRKEIAVVANLKKNYDIDFLYQDVTNFLDFIATILNRSNISQNNHDYLLALASNVIKSASLTALYLVKDLGAYGKKNYILTLELKRYLVIRRVITEFIARKLFLVWQGIVLIGDEFSKVLECISIPVHSMSDIFTWWRIYGCLGAMLTDFIVNINESDHFKELILIECSIDLPSITGKVFGEIVALETVFNGNVDMYHRFCNDVDTNSSVPDREIIEFLTYLYCCAKKDVSISHDSIHLKLQSYQFQNADVIKKLDLHSQQVKQYMSVLVFNLFPIFEEIISKLNFRCEDSVTLDEEKAFIDIASGWRVDPGQQKIAPEKFLFFIYSHFTNNNCRGELSYNIINYLYCFFPDNQSVDMI